MHSSRSKNGTTGTVIISVCVSISFPVTSISEDEGLTVRRSPPPWYGPRWEFDSRCINGGGLLGGGGGLRGAGAGGPSGSGTPAARLSSAEWRPLKQCGWLHTQQRPGDRQCL